MSVGCGDALLAGFISACAEGAASPEALRFGIACGSACARSDYACLTSRNQPKSFLARVRVAAL
jgi:fructose-1-phosphate kinase PfkB-like protein